jgi:hypothetical protein
MKLTIAKLRALGACQSALERLEAIFGQGPITVTEALCVEHASAGINWIWAGDRLLTPAALAEYDRVRAAAWIEHDLACMTVRAERVQACTAAWAEYDRAAAWAESKWATASVRTKHEQATAVAWAEHERATVAIWAEYDRACASAFGRLAEAQA